MARNTSVKRINCEVTEQHKAEFDFIQESLNIRNQGDVISTLLNSYRELKELKKQETDYSDFKLTSEEEQIVTKAVQLSGMSREEILKRGLLKEARTAISLAKHQSELADANPEELKKMTFKGVAAARIEQVITKVMEWNDSHPEQKDRFYISETLIYRLTGSNRSSIKNYFESHKVWIDDHNYKYSLTNDDNRKGKGFDAKEVLGI